MRTKECPTTDHLKHLFYYEDGLLIWKNPVLFSNAKKFDIAGHKDNWGYIIISVEGIKYKAHRLIWVYHNGPIGQELQIDHINGIKDDNHIENLRLVTINQNLQNRRDVSGIHWDNRANKWHAQIQVMGKKIYLGRYTTKELAIEARRLGELKYFTHSPKNLSISI